MKQKKYLKRTNLKMLISRIRKAMGTFEIILLLLALALFVFAFVWGPNTTLPTDTNLHWPAPTLAKPGYLQTAIDPSFGAKIIRVSGDPGTNITTAGGTVLGQWGTTTRHNYSLDAAWNSDQSMIMLALNNGCGSPPCPMVFINGQTYQPLFTRLWNHEVRWDPTNGSRMLYINGNVLSYWYPATNTYTTIKTFRGVTNGGFGPNKGNLSMDGRFIVISNNGTSYFAYDIVNKVRYPDIIPTRSGVTVSYGGISPLGNYIFIVWNDDVTWVYNKTGGAPIQQWTEVGGLPSHADLTVDSDGSEVAVGVSKVAGTSGKIIKRRLSDGVITTLTTGGYASHTSARCVNRNGWVISTYSNRDRGTITGGVGRYDPYLNELDAIKLDGTRVERICHLYSTEPTTNPDPNYAYNAQPQGSASPDGLRVIYASNWEDDSGPIQAYVADFRDKLSGTTDSLGTIDSVSSSLTSQQPKTMQMVLLTVNTTNMANNTPFSVELLTSAGDHLSPVVSANGMISNNHALIPLIVPSRVSAGSYFFKVTANSITNNSANYTISPSAPKATQAISFYNGIATYYSEANLVSNGTITTNGILFIPSSFSYQTQNGVSVNYSAIQGMYIGAEITTKPFNSDIKLSSKGPIVVDKAKFKIPTGNNDISLVAGTYISAKGTHFTSKDTGIVNLTAYQSIDLTNADIKSGHINLSAYDTTNNMITVNANFHGVTPHKTANNGVAPIPPPDSTQNLIKNPGFENGLTFWDIDGGNDSVVTGNAHTGSYAIRIGTGSGYREQNITTGFAEGDTLTLSGWGKMTDLSNSGEMGVDCLNSSGSVISEFRHFFTTTEYAQLSTNFTVPAGTVKMQVYVYKNASTSYFYADDISLTPNSSGRMALNRSKPEISLLKAGEYVKIYPNPSRDYIIIDANLNDSKVQMSIFDIQGRKFWTHSYENSNGYLKEKVDVRNLAAGIYILKILERGRVVSKEFKVK